MKDISWKKSISVALAYVGVIVGAGFASGQEILQYYVSFGGMGFWGLIVSALVFMTVGVILLQFGSYYIAQDHTEVFDEITHPIVSKIIDIGINVTLFLIGFVMIAGAGSNLNQQYGLPVWVGSGLLAILLFVSAFLDVDKLTNVIGAITPFVIALIVLATVYVLFTTDLSFAQATAMGMEQPTTLPNWFISAINYSAFGLMTAVSMAVVIGGDEFFPLQSGLGGMFGGLLISILLLFSYVVLTLGIETAAASSMPLLAIIDEIHPILGVVMSVVILGMIYNTAIGMYYPLAKRITRNHPGRFVSVMAILIVIGFAVSFFGFETLVATVYPFIGYFGMIIFVLLIWQYIKYFKKIRASEKRRRKILHSRLGDNDVSEEEVQRLIDESQVENKQFETKLEQRTEFREEERGE